MRVRVVGAGLYGCHVAASLLESGHDVEVHEIASEIFAGASGGIPARLHVGAFHYPRSAKTRAACVEHRSAFMEKYGHLTKPVPINLYCVAANDSIVDFGTYLDILRAGAIEFITLHDPAEFGLENIEGAVMTGERHIVIREARKHFERALHGRVCFGTEPGDLNDPQWDWTVDCTFAALANDGVDRYEPCLTALLLGPVDKSVTVVDGPYPSVYVWDEMLSISSLTSAKLTPLSKTCRSYQEAKAILDSVTVDEARIRSNEMLEQMAYFWPECRERYRIADHRLSIRAMPRSASDARLVDVVRVGERAVRVRAGKIDAILHAERVVRELIGA